MATKAYNSTLELPSPLTLTCILAQMEKGGGCARGVVGREVRFGSSLSLYLVPRHHKPSTLSLPHKLRKQKTNRQRITFCLKQ